MNFLKIQTKKKNYQFIFKGMYANGIMVYNGTIFQKKKKSTLKVLKNLYNCSGCIICLSYDIKLLKSTNETLQFFSTLGRAKVMLFHQRILRHFLGL